MSTIDLVPFGENAGLAAMYPLLLHETPQARQKPRECRLLATYAPIDPRIPRIAGFVVVATSRNVPSFLIFPRRSFPNRINPIAILNNSIGRNQRTAEVPGGRYDGSVRRVTDRNQRYRFK